MIDVIKNIRSLSFRLPDELSGLDEKNRAVMLDDVVSILEEYERNQSKTDWISCEVETPKTNGVYQTVRKVIEGDVVYYLEGASYFDGQNTWHNDICVNHGRAYLTNVVAWQPIQPYKKEGAENGKI